MTTANLGFAIDSSPLVAAASELDRLTSSAGRAETAASRVSGAGTRMSRGFGDLNPALEKIVGSLSRLEVAAGSIDKRLSNMSVAANNAAKANVALDRSVIETSTAYKELEAALNAVQATQRRGDASLASSLAMIEKQREAIARLNAEMQKLRNGAGAPGRPAPANNNGGQGSVGNVAAQLFDIGSTAAFMNPLTVGIQQGPQLAQAFAGQSTRQALSSLAGGLAAIASPLSLVTIGLTAGASALIGWGVSAISASTSTEKLDDVLERHEGLLKRLEERYGSLIEKAKGFATESSRTLAFQASSDIRALRNSSNLAGTDFFQGVGTQTRGGYRADSGLLGLSEGFRPFNEAITRLRNEFKAGRPDFEAFYDSIYKTAQTDPKYAKKADELAKLVDQFKQGSQALQDMERIQSRLFNAVGPNGMILSQGSIAQDDMNSYAFYQSRQRIAAQRSRQAMDAQLYGINARSPSERAEAARRAESARYDDTESVAARRQRIEQAGTLAQAQAERQLAEAQRERARNFDKILADQQSEIDLVGKTGGAATALRKEYELTSQLRLEAARQGIDVDQKELDLIHERSKALGDLTDQYNQSRFNFEMGRQASDAQLSPRNRQITTTLRQYGLPEDLNGANAGTVRKQLEFQDTKEMFSGFFTSFEQEAFKNGGKIGDALGKATLNALQKSLDRQLENIFDQLGTALANWLLGSKSSGGAAAASGVGKLLSPANANAAPVMSVTRAALPNVGATTDVASYIASAAAKRGIDPDVALRVAKSEGGLSSWNLQSNYVKNGVREQSFGPFQLYKGGGLGNSFMNKTGLDPAMAANGPAGVDFALDHAAKNGWGSWYGAGKAGIGNWQGIGAGGADSAAKAVDKLASSAGAATKGLDTFGGGLGKIGQSLSTSFFPAAPQAAAGGGGGFFASLFGGLFRPRGAQATLAASGSIHGLFANGTDYAPGGLSIVGEAGPELLNLPQGSQVMSNQKLKAMAAANNNSSGPSRPGTLNVHVHGANGDDHVRELVQQGVRQGLSSYDEENRRGGFGRTQGAYNSDKA